MLFLELILLMLWLSPIVWVSAVFITKKVERRRLQIEPLLREQGRRITERTSRRMPARQANILSARYHKIEGSARQVTLYLN